MSICKECLHYEACNKFDIILGLPTTDQLRVDEYCGCYKNASDIVEVVRCRDCKHCTLTKDGEYNPEDIVCGYFMTDGMQANDFCSYGKRREE